MDKIFEVAGIPMLLVLVCFYYGMKLLITKDVSLIRGNDKPKPKDNDKYCKAAAVLILSYGGASLLMGALLFVNSYIAFAEIVVATVVLGFGWKDINSKYGA